MTKPLTCYSATKSGRSNDVCCLYSCSSLFHPRANWRISTNHFNVSTDMAGIFWSRRFSRIKSNGPWTGKNTSETPRCPHRSYNLSTRYFLFSWYDSKPVFFVGHYHWWACLCTFVGELLSRPFFQGRIQSRLNIYHIGDLQSARVPFLYRISSRLWLTFGHRRKPFQTNLWKKQHRN